MRSIKIAGLALVAVFALGAIAAGSAFAESAPKFGVCGAAAKEKVEWTENSKPKSKEVPTGRYEEKECHEKNETDVYRVKGEQAGHKEGPEGKYELTPLAEQPTVVPFTGKSKAVVITTRAGAEGEPAGNWWVIVCGKSTVSGGLSNTYATQTEKGDGKATKETITFEKCEGQSNGKEAVCKNTEVEGKPVIQDGPGSVSEIEWGEAGEEKPVLITLGGPIFECGSEAIEMHGSLIGTLENNSKGINVSWSVGGEHHTQAPDEFFSGGNLQEEFFYTRWYTGEEEVNTEQETTVAGITALKTETKGVSVRTAEELYPEES